MDIKFSVVVPVYNVANYLKYCIESIINQTYKNLEIILVDDGSTDKSSEICDFFKEKDNRIKVINKKNGGASSARNVGIENSTGDYLIFIDGDDYWDDNTALDQVYKNLIKSKVDVLMFGFKKYYESNKVIEKSKYIFDIDMIDINSKKNTINYLVKNNLLISSPCNKVIKINLFDENNLKFKEGIIAEDIDWNLRLAINAGSFGVLNNAFYIYRQRECSITHSKTLKHIEDLLENLEFCINILNEDNSKVDFIDEYMSYVAYQYMTILVSIKQISEKVPEEIMKKIKDFRYLLKFNLNYRVNIFYVINKYLGFSVLNIFIKFYLMLQRG